MSTHHMLDIAPIPEKVLYINEPWLIDASFDGMEKVSEEPDPNPDNVRVYLPLDLNAEAILRRLRYVIYRYGEANEANESNYGADVNRMVSQIEIYDQVWRIRDGDRINILLATYLRDQGRLPANTVVVTEYSNYATVKYLEAQGIKVEKVVNGDRFVAQKLQALGAELGSEYSGHMIYSPWLKASDGTFTALFIQKIMHEKKMRLADMWADFEFMPSKQWGVKVSEKRPLTEVAGFDEAVRKTEAEFAGKGRVFCRYSGTENKLRILVEGEDKDLIEKHGEILAKIIEKEIGA